jgi:hypothetical protein
VPACSSSPIPAVAQRLASPATLVPEQCRDLLDDLAQIADPRHRRGRRHALGAVLAVAVAAVLAGAKSLAAIGEWAADAPGPVLAALGVRRDPLRRVWRPPGEATVRRVLARVDPDALDLVIGRWLADQQPSASTTRPPPAPRPPRRAVAVDGKTLRGSGHHPSPPVHLLAVMDHTTGAVLAQADVEALLHLGRRCGWRVAKSSRFPSRRLPEVLKAINLCIADGVQGLWWRTPVEWSPDATVPSALLILANDVSRRTGLVLQASAPGGRCAPRHCAYALAPGAPHTGRLSPHVRPGQPTGPGRAAPQWDPATPADPRGRSQGGR